MGKISLSLIILLCFLPLLLGDEMKSLSELLKSDKNYIEINEPIVLKENLILEKAVYFLQDGCIVQGGNHKLRIEAPLQASLKLIFRGFSPGEITFAKGSVKEVYPQWWGAKGDGVTDDYIPLQSALDSGCATIFLPKGRYRITKPLNITNRAHGLIIIGQGQSEDGSIIVGDTGGVALDASGSRYLHFANFAIVSGETNPSTVGILFSRTKEIGFVEFNNLENIRVHLRSDGKVNNGNGTVGIYNNAAELWRARNIYVMADNPLVFTGYNIFNIESPFTKREEGYVSMSECTVDGASTLHAFLGPALIIENGDTIEVLNAYLTRSGEAGFPYAIRVMNFWGINLTYTGHIEGFTRFLYTDVTNLVSCHFKATLYTSGEPLIYLDGKKERPSLQGCEINLIPEPTSKPSPLLLGEGNVAMNHNRITLYPGQSIDSLEGEFLGNIIQAWDDKPAIKLNPQRASYMLITPKGGETINTSPEDKK